MKKIIFILFSVFFVYGCFPAIHIINENRFINRQNLIKQNFNKNIYFNLQNGERFYLFGFIPTLFRGNNLTITLENSNNPKDLKINSYIIKINGKKKIEKNKNIKIDYIISYKKGCLTYSLKKIFTSYKKDDLIEIILDVSVFNNGSWERNVISEKYMGIKKYKELYFLWD